MFSWDLGSGIDLSQDPALATGAFPLGPSGKEGGSSPLTCNEALAALTGTASQRANALQVPRFVS